MQDDFTALNVGDVRYPTPYLDGLLQMPDLGLHLHPPAAAMSASCFDLQAFGGWVRDTDYSEVSSSRTLRRQCGSPAAPMTCGYGLTPLLACIRYGRVLVGTDLPCSLTTLASRRMSILPSPAPRLHHRVSNVALYCHTNTSLQCRDSSARNPPAMASLSCIGTLSTALVSPRPL